MRSFSKWVASLSVIALMVIFSPSADARETNVFDQGNLFTPSEISQLEENITAFIAESQMDALVVTTNDAQGKTAEAYADDFYDEGGYGLDSDHSGFLFLIDMDNRTYHISTAGKTIKLFTDQRIDRMLERAAGDMSAGDYAAAAESVLTDACKYASSVKYDQQTGTFKKVRKITFLEGMIGLIAAIVTGVVSFTSVYGTYNLKRSTYTYSYRDKGQLALKSKEDQLINTVTTSRYIPPSNSSGGGGGSSTHTSSGGSSHGGGGRSF